MYHSDTNFKDRLYINIQPKWSLYFGSERLIFVYTVGPVYYAPPRKY